jgi:hypothetical protein
LVTFFIISTLISNVIEGQAGLSAEQVANLGDMQSQQITESKDVAATGITTTGINPLSALQAFWKAITLEYSFLYETYYGMTQTTCGAISNSRWYSATSTCLVPNEWMLPFIIIMWGPLAGIAFYLVLTIWHSIFRTW